jgi:nucleotide-binding universal stress UspA family protein
MKDEIAIKKILVPADESLPSVLAEELTASLAKKFNAEVTVIYVISHELMHPEVGEFFPEMYDYRPTGVTGSEVSVSRGVPAPSSAPRVPRAVAREINSWHHQRGEQILENATALFKQEGIEAERKLIEHADPANTIMKEAKKGKYDLIVMGQSDEEKEEPHLGSIAEKVSRHAETPVLTVRDIRKISKILVAVDGSERAARALTYASMLAKNTGAEMTMLYVQEPSVFNFRPELAKKIGDNILSWASEQVKGVKMNQKMESGDPAKAIIATADKEGSDLIVMGSRGHGSVTGFLLGSVSNHVLHYARHSVLIVK